MTEPRPIGTSEVVTCERCEGRGYVYLGYYVKERYKCIYCNRTGKVRQTVVAHEVREVLKEEPAE